MADIVAVLDANVLFPASLRDTLLRAGEAGLYQMYWTDEILEEVRRNLIKTGFATEAQARHLLEAINENLGDRFIKLEYQSLIPSMTNDPKDRHVLAAAVAAGAKTIVTSNLRDFPLRATQPYHIEAVHPDEFLMRLFNRQAEIVVKLIITQSQAQRRPPKTLMMLLDELEKAGPLPRFTYAIRAYLVAHPDVIDSPNPQN